MVFYVMVGMFEGWCELVVLVVDNFLLMFVMLVVMVGFLFGLLNIDGGGVYFYGDLLCGKIIVLLVGISVWGGVLFKCIWWVMVNGFEGVGFLYFDMLFVLDEFGEIDLCNLYEFVYVFVNGMGKMWVNWYGEVW